MWGFHGAFYELFQMSPTDVAVYVANGSRKNIAYMGFDLNRVNSAYQNNAKVRPESYQCRFYIRYK